jgi:hypothetical protein
MSSIEQDDGAVEKQPTTFREFWEFGYPRLVPIVPPDAEVHEASSIAKRMAAGKDARGKVPGLRGFDGKWRGYDFTARDPDESDLARYQEWGGGIGIKTGDVGDGRSLLLVDADTLDKAHANLIHDAVSERFGLLPMRIGQSPKAGYVILCSGPFRYDSVLFGPVDERGQQPSRCEILSDNRQFVAHGIHPKTRKPYSWPVPLMPLDQIPCFEPEEISAFMRHLEAVLPNTKRQTSGADTVVSQESLKGDLELIRKAVAMTPNTSAQFPTREAYRDFGYAIKAATIDHPQEGLAIFEEWSDRWIDPPEGGENKEGFAAAEWSRMKPPFRVGQSYVYEKAEPQGFNVGEAWFSAVTPEEEAANRNEIAEGVRTKHAAAMAAAPDIEAFTPYRRWQGLMPTKREWIVEGFIPKGETTLLYGSGGIGKTLLAHQLATCVAAGLDWLGQKTMTGRVLCFLAEDREQELHRRQLAIDAGLGLGEGEAHRDRLWISCRRDSDNLIALFERNGAMTLPPAWHKLRALVLARRIEFLILDTLADIFPGDEINRNQVTQFVKGCLGRLGAETGCTIMVLGHPSKSGAQTDGTSGSTAWNNAVRSRLWMRYPGKLTSGDHRELEGMKSNYGPKGSILKLKWTVGHFVPTSASNVPRATGNVIGMDGQPMSACAAIPNSDDVCDRALIAAIEALKGEQLGTGVSSPYHAPVVAKRVDPCGGLEPFDLPTVKASFERLTRQGVFERCELGLKGRNKTFGLQVKNIARAADLKLAGGLFE